MEFTFETATPLLARTPAFLSPRVSGLGRVLQHAREDAPPMGKTRAKEA